MMNQTSLWRCKTSLPVFAALLVGPLAATAAHSFVSASGTWKMEGLDGTCYTSLQEAVNAAAAGDTVWMQDGFVCASGNGGSISGKGYARVKLPKIAFTLRSESGYVDEGNGKGACIRGEKDPDSTYEDGRGTNAIRPVWSQTSSTVLQGLILENGSTGDAHNYGAGGAVYDPVTLTNCLLRNVTAYCGGGIASGSAVAFNTVISNCYAFGTGYGGGAVFGGASLYDCTLVSNSAAKSGGAIYCNNSTGGRAPIYSNCVFRGNHSPYAGGCLYTKDQVRATFIDCQILDNRATYGSHGGIRGMADLIRCTIAGNFADNPGNRLQAFAGGVGATAYNVDQSVWPYLVDCLVSNNTTYGTGGGLYYGIASNCTFTCNFSCGNGAGVHNGILTDCRLIGNTVSNFVSDSNSEMGNGGGCSDSVATNCIITGNSVWAQNRVSSGNGGGVAHSDLVNCIVANNWACYRGAAAYCPVNGKTFYNCLIVSNSSPAPHVGYDRGMIIEGEAANTLSSNPPRFYNCTIADNQAPNYACINDAELYNCIVWNNDVPTEIYPNQVWCCHTCQKDLAPGVDGNVNQNPRLSADYRLTSGKPCMDTGQTFDWMTDIGDARAKDLAGRNRIIGAGPDMGCYERIPPATMFMCH